MRTRFSEKFAHGLLGSLLKVEFEEAEHPRGERGRFVPKEEAEAPMAEPPKPQKVTEGLDRRFLHVEVESPDVVNPHISLEYSVPRTVEVPGKGRMQQGSDDANLSGKIDRDKKRVVLTTLYVSKPLGRKGIGTALVLEAARRSPVGYEVTTSGMLSEGGRALFESMTARGLAIKTDIGNYIVKPIKAQNPDETHLPQRDGAPAKPVAPEDEARGLSDLISNVSTDIKEDLGPVTVRAFRVGETKDPGWGIFFGGTKEEVEPYASLHEGHEVKEYVLEAKNPFVARAQYALFRHLYGKSMQDGIYEWEQRHKGKGGNAQREIEARMARDLRKKGYDAIIYTKPPAPAKHEIAIIDPKSASFREVKKA